MIQTDDEVRVISASGKNGKYVSRPRRFGRVVEVEDDKGLVRFPQMKREVPYYQYDHWFYLKDLKVVHRRSRKAKRRRRKR